MKTKDECIATLRQFKNDCASKYGIRSIGIFGSVMFDIRETLQSLLGCKVDLVRLREGLRDLLLKRIEQDGVYA